DLHLGAAPLLQAAQGGKAELERVPIRVGTAVEEDPERPLFAGPGRMEQGGVRRWREIDGGRSEVSPVDFTQARRVHDSGKAEAVRRLDQGVVGARWIEERLVVLDEVELAPRGAVLEQREGARPEGGDAGVCWRKRLHGSA